MCYRNFLFDLYGTLADIHTNESKKALWASLAGWYRAHGAQYSPWRLRRRYLELAEQERKDAGQHIRHFKRRYRAAEKITVIFLIPIRRSIIL